MSDAAAQVLRMRREAARRLLEPEDESEPDWFTGTAAIVSDGASGSYVEASHPGAARLFFPGGGEPSVGPATLLLWVDATGSPDGTILEISDDGTPALRLTVLEVDDPADTFDAQLQDAGAEFANVTAPTLSAGLHHVAIVVASDTITLFVDGVEIGSTAIEAAEWAAVNTLALFANRSHGDRVPVPVRSPSIHNRAFGAAEIATLANPEVTGPNYDIREPIGDYAGPGVTFGWYPAKGDVLPTITDRGNLGCDWNASGGITIVSA